jgi:hypothetical protein
MSNSGTLASPAPTSGEISVQPGTMASAPPAAGAAVTRRYSRRDSSRTVPWQRSS